MTTKMERFVREYLIDFNATQAAIRSGYSENTAAEIGFENLRKPQIAEIIEKEKKRIIGDTESIIIENITFWKTMKLEAKNDSDRLKASEHLGRYAAMFTDRVDSTLHIDAPTLTTIKEIMGGNSS